MDPHVLTMGAVARTGLSCPGQAWTGLDSKKNAWGPATWNQNSGPKDIPLPNIISKRARTRDTHWSSTLFFVVFTYFQELQAATKYVT